VVGVVENILEYKCKILLPAEEGVGVNFVDVGGGACGSRKQ
jgi:hypothetical protein